MVKEYDSLDYTISMDKNKLQINYIHHYLSIESYWAKNIPIDTVKKSIKGSICFGVYNQDAQIGFARVITDEATFAYLADVFIDENHRGKGLSKKMMAYIMAFLETKQLRRVMLATKDAHTLYEQFGFSPIPDPTKLMGIKFFEEY